MAENSRGRLNSGDQAAIDQVNDILRDELSKRSDFRRENLDDGPHNGRVWRVWFASNGKDTVVQYFNDSAPREYKMDIPKNTVAKLVGIARQHEQVTGDNHKIDIALFYDKPLISVAID